MNRWINIAAGAVLGFTVLGGVAFWLLREPTVLPVVTTPMVPRLSSVPPPPSSQTGTAAVSSTAPWNLPSPVASATIAPGGVERGASAPPTIAQIQSRLQAIGASKQPSITELDSALADLEKNRGSSLIGNVDISVLRDTLARANRIQILAQEVQSLSTGAPGPNTAAQLESKVNEIQQLQSGIRSAMVPTPGVR